MPIAIDRLTKAALRPRPTVYKSLREAEAQGARTAFLCHSHKDQILVEGLVNLLQESQWNVYVDWADPGMPPTPNQETAERIRTKIRETDFFLFLATPQSVSSRWCPWEIGYADGVKANNRIWIIPTRSDSTDHGNEYLGLYRKLDWSGNERLAVWRPGETNGTWVGAL